MGNLFKSWLESIPKEESRLCSSTCWQPAADIYQTPDGWIIKLDLAGVRPEDIRVQVAGRQLTVAGIRRDQLQQAGIRYYRMEISYSSFQRSIELPGEVIRPTSVASFGTGCCW